MRLILIRHGEAKRGTGEDKLRDYGLTKQGRSQVEKTRSVLTEPIDVVLCSQLPRARETARILSLSNNIPEQAIEPSLCEIAENKDYLDETLETFFNRVREFLHSTEKAYTNQTVLAVTHAGFIMASLRVLFDIPTPGTGARLEPDYASATNWSFKNNHWELRSYNVLPTAT